LEVAAALARQGKKAVARALAQKLDYPRARSINDLPGAAPFRFDDSKTWGARYEFMFAVGIHSMMGAQQREDELLAAAVRCRVALDGRDSITRRVMSKRWNVRRTAEAQASEGDAAGALKWSAELPRPQRLAALIGAAEGHAEHRNAAQQKPTNRLPIDWRHNLVQSYGISCDDD
jgi:hypothetical protein